MLYRHVLHRGALSQLSRPSITILPHTIRLPANKSHPLLPSTTWAGRYFSTNHGANDGRQRPVHTSKASSEVDAEEPSHSEEKGKRKSLSMLIATHGPVFTVYWGSAYLVSLGAIYGGLSYTGPELGVTLAKACSLDSFMTIDPTASTLVLAIALNEVFEVVRLPVILATLPRVSKAWYRFRGSSGPSGASKANQRANMIKVHGVFFVGYWSFLWVCSGLGCYAAIEVLGPDVAISGLRYLGLDSLVNLDSINPQYFNIGFAVAINELLEPIRFPLTLATLLPAKRLLGMHKPKQ